MYEFDEKAEIKALASYLLSNSALAGKTFVIFNEEGDWQLRQGYVNISDQCSFHPDATRVQAMRDWLNARQDAVTEARQLYPNSAVRVYYGAEVNKVEWAINEADPNLTCGATLTNDVLPYTHCDLYTYSFWEFLRTPQGLIDNPAKAVVDRLNYIKTKAPDSPSFGHYNVAITEFGANLHNADTNGDQALQAQILQQVTQAAIAWGSPYVLQWQVWDGAPLPSSPGPVARPTASEADGFYLIDPDGNHTAAYDFFHDLLQRSLLRAGLRTSDAIHYVSADNDGGAGMFVNAPWIREWSTWPSSGRALAGRSRARQ